VARDHHVPRVPGELAEHPGAQAHRASGLVRLDLGFDAQLRYLCNDAQLPSRPARFAALAAASESFTPYVGPKWTYIGFPYVAAWRLKPGPSVRCSRRRLKCSCRPPEPL
jgi:hypothetical protein